MISMACKGLANCITFLWGVFWLLLQVDRFTTVCDLLTEKSKSQKLKSGENEGEN